MKKRMFLLLMLTALCLSLSAQSATIEIKGTDTCAVIPIAQMRLANAKFVQLKGCLQENDSLFSQIRAYTGLTNNLRSSLLELKEVNKLNETLLNDKQKIIDLGAQELKKEARKVSLLRLQRNSVAAACLILIIKIAFFK